MRCLTLVLAFASLITTILFLENFRKWEHAVKKSNYRNKEIITAGGVVFVIVILLINVYTVFYWDDTDLPEYIMLSAACMGFSGLMDDIYGTKAVKGIRGHFSKLLRGKITTGSIKAIIGLSIACFLAVKKNDFWPDIIIDALIIALSTNLLNLMDLRPGRACKFFLFSVAIIFLYFLRKGLTNLIYFFMPLAVSVMVFWFYDSRELLMMGDVGSNVLGISLGIMISWIGSYYAKIGVLSFLLGIQLISEFYSISEILERIISFRKKFSIY